MKRGLKCKCPYLDGARCFVKEASPMKRGLKYAVSDGGGERDAR